MKRVVILIAAAACLTLTGCSAAAFWLSGCGSPEDDLIVVNHSGREVWSITLDYENERQGVRSARDRALLGQGESCGLELEEGRVTVILSGRNGGELGRSEVGFAGERLYLTLERDGSLSLSPAGDGGGAAG